MYWLLCAARAAAEALPMLSFAAIRATASTGALPWVHPNIPLRGRCDRPVGGAPPSSVQSGLFLGRRERPRGTRAPLLAEHQPQLLRRFELRRVRAEGRTRLGEIER